MANKKENLYLTIKWSKINTVLTETEQDILHILLDKIDWHFGKVLNGRTSLNTFKVNKYIICNQDEPYADKVWEIILEGEDAKAKANS